jgi:hypothetical protein
MIEQLLVGLAARGVGDGIYAIFRSLIRQEITELNSERLLTEPFRTALLHLQNAEVEHDEDRRRQHLEYARLEFMKASNLDAPLASARAAFYVGICHHLRNETHNELSCYKRSIAMMSALEDDLRAKAAKWNAGRAATSGLLGLIFALPGVGAASLVSHYQAESTENNWKRYKRNGRPSKSSSEVEPTYPR